MELSPSIKELSQLKVLGISYTKVQEIPAAITSLQNLYELNCYETPIKKPDLMIAKRGIKAIIKYYTDQI